MQYSEEDKICYPLTGGTTVYIKIYGSDNYLRDFTVSKEDLQEVSVGEETLSLVSDEKKWICFKPENVEQDTDYCYRITGSSDSENILECYYSSYFEEPSWKDDGMEHVGFLYVGEGDGEGYDKYVEVNYYTYSEDSEIICMISG